MIGEGKKDIAIRGTMINLFRAFDQYFPQWEKIVTSIATLDVLCSLTIFSSSFDGPMCLPEFLKQTDQPTIRIIDGRHPMLCRYFNSGDFIPNDIILGGKLTFVLVRAIFVFFTFGRTRIVCTQLKTYTRLKCTFL